MARPRSPAAWQATARLSRGGQGLLDVPGHAFGPDLAMVAGEHFCLVEQVSGGVRAGVRWRVAGQGVDVREQYPPRRPACRVLRVRDCGGADEADPTGRLMRITGGAI
jgi:hypothetical protein